MYFYGIIRGCQHKEKIFWLLAHGARCNGSNKKEEINSHCLTGGRFGGPARNRYMWRLIGCHSIITLARIFVYRSEDSTTLQLGRQGGGPSLNALS